MSFSNGPKFKRVQIKSEDIVSEEMAQLIVDAWNGVMKQLGYLTMDNPTVEERAKAIEEAELDGIIVIASKRVYNDDEIIYDIVIQQIGAEIVFERGDAKDSPLQ